MGEKKKKKNPLGCDCYKSLASLVEFLFSFVNDVELPDFRRYIGESRERETDRERRRWNGAGLD